MQQQNVTDEQSFYYLHLVYVFFLMLLFFSFFSEQLLPCMPEILDTMYVGLKDLEDEVRQSAGYVSFLVFTHIPQ